MQVRVFEAADMASGLKRVKQELGPNALILSTRTIKSGKLGILGKNVIEITAAVDADIPKDTAQDTIFPGQQSEPSLSAGKKSHDFRHVVGDPVTQYLSNHTESSGTEQQQVSQSKPSVLNQRETNLEGEFNELKDLVKNLAGQISQLTAKEAMEQEPQPQVRQGALHVKEVDFPSRAAKGSLIGDHILSLLIDCGINVETSRTITGFLRQSLTEQELCNPGLVSQTIISTIQNLIEVDPPVFSSGQSQQRIALVGPTGVGKTTTLAKIAASYLSKFSNSIALITIDTYRIAAVEQLKVYGEIMQLPVEVVINPEQLQQSIARHSDKELILIDTAGRSPRDSFCIDELATFLCPDLQIDNHLVLSAGTRENELLETIERFNSLGISNTIFTKVDECSCLGILLNVQIQNPTPLSYVTNGQRVPEDLLEISPKIVAELIMSQYQGTMHD